MNHRPPRPGGELPLRGRAASCQGRTIGRNFVRGQSFRRSGEGRVAIRPQGVLKEIRHEWIWTKMTTIRGLMTQTVGVGLLFLSGCQAVRNMGDEFGRLTSSHRTSAPTQKTSTAQPVARPRSAASVSTPPASTEPSINATASASAAPTRSSSDSPTVALAGKSESELRALLGTPTSEEDRPPGKRWRYRDGQCTLDVQLYPDVQTKQFGTLAYEVKSDDNTDEGRRLCLAQLQTRVQARQ